MPDRGNLWIMSRDPQMSEDEYGRIRRVDEGPDGALYAITDDGALLRIGAAR